MPAKSGEIKGRKCYDHLGGKLGALLFERYITLGWIELEEDKATVYRVTDEGRAQFARLGLLPEEKQG